MQDFSDPDFLVLGIAWYCVFLFSTVLHEAAHAAAAYYLGDPTAYYGGQVSLNPVPHIEREPWGMVVIPFISYFTAGFIFGWASAPYNLGWAMRYPRRAGFMALAGPLSNLLIVIVAGVLIRTGLGTGLFTIAPSAERFGLLASEYSLADGAGRLLCIMYFLNLLLFTFNLFPMPPLDGFGVLQIFLDEPTSRRMQMFMLHPIARLVGLVAAWNLAGPVIQAAYRFSLPYVFVPG